MNSTTINLVQMPEYPLVQIFKHLPYSSLRDMMMINSHFFHVITTNSALYSKTRLVIDREKLIRKASKLCTFMNKYLWKSDLRSQMTKTILNNRRKHVHIRLVNVVQSDKHENSSPEASIMFEILQKLSFTIKTLQITEELLDLNFFALLLKELPNLENVEIVLKNWEHSSEPCSTSDLRHLKKLKIHTIYHFASFESISQDFLKIFENVTTLETLELFDVQINVFLPFLRQQRKLKKLIIEGRMLRPFLEHFADDFPVQLKEFILIKTPSELQNLPMLTKFLTGQNELTFLQLRIHSGGNFQNLLQSMINMQKLHHLELDIMGREREFMEFKGTNSSIKSLSVNFSSMLISERFVHTLIGIKNINLSFNNCIGRTTYPASMTFNMLPNLEYIQLDFTSECVSLLITHDVKLKNLKELKVEAVNGTCEEWEWFFANNTEIEILSIINCGFTDQMLKIITVYLKNLINFTCYDHLTNKGIDYLFETCSGLKVLEVETRGIKPYVFKMVKSEGIEN